MNKINSLKKSVDRIKSEGISLSIVIPVYNEAQSLESLYNELTTVLKKLKKS